MNRIDTIDTFTALKAQEKALKTQLDTLRKAIIKLGVGEHEGGVGVVQVEEVTSTRFSGEAAKQFLTEAQISKCERTTTSRRVTIIEAAVASGNIIRAA